MKDTTHFISCVHSIASVQGSVLFLPFSTTSYPALLVTIHHYAFIQVSLIDLNETNLTDISFVKLMFVISLTNICDYVRSKTLCSSGIL